MEGRDRYRLTLQLNLAIFMKVANFGLQPSFPYFTSLFNPKKGKVARLQWYLKTVFAGQIFDRSRLKKREMAMEIQAGTILEFESNSYVIKEYIDMGGNGSVWKAELPGDSRPYAIKILNNDASGNREKRARFDHECRFCKNTNNKNIVKIFDYIAEKGKAYCVMPYYSKNLRTVVDTENDSFVLLNYIIQLCEAIRFIHHHDDGIIHRDLKPENVLVGDDNTLILTDFGIAHFEDSVETREREWLGNRRYAAPEQLATDEVTTACDIYALGRIINELFTKQNPSGEAFLTIADKNPLLLPLDGIVQKCRIQNPELRPSIDEILTELYLLEGEIKDKLEDIKEMLYPFEETDYSEDEEEAIITQAAQDILLAQYIFDKMPDEKLQKINAIYHRNILYDMDELIQNLLFQTYVLDSCMHNFKYEAVSYINGQSYEPLNLEDGKEKQLYDELNDILDNHKIPYNCRDITARIKKLFCSCCNYHCIELLDDIKSLCEKESHLVRAPILHIVYVLRKELSKDDLSEVDLVNQITINWKSMPNVVAEQPEIYLASQGQEEIKVLDVLKEQYDALYDKADFKHYYVRFKTTDEFNKFKNYALELSRPYYVFEGDVEKVIRVRREYRGIVELEPLDSFDITSTLAKILGLRNDY